MKSPVSIQRRRISGPTRLAGTWPVVSPLAAGIMAIALVATVFAIYSPALGFKFILDDHHFISDPRLRSPGYVWEYFTSYVWAQFAGGPSSFYRPLFVLWLRLNFILNGASPWRWHLLSIVKHVSVAVLLGILSWKLLRDRSAALIAGTLFALHPAQTESVAWVTVPDPLMSAAVLGGLLLYLRYVERACAAEQLRDGRARRKSRKKALDPSKRGTSTAWLAASAVACLAALMAKETAVVLPVIIFAMAVLMPVHKHDKEGGAARESVSIRLSLAFRDTLPFIGMTAIYLALRFHALGGRLSPPTQHLPWSVVVLSWPATLWFYVKVLLWPVRSRAFADPILANAFSVRGVLLPGLGVFCAAAVLIGGTVWAWTAARHLPDREAHAIQRALLLGTSILVLPILLTLNLNALNPGDFLHGRYTYLSLSGLMLLLGTGWHLAKKARVALLVGIISVGVTFAVLTAKQEIAWKDDLTVFTVAHQNAPYNEPVALNLSRANVQVALAMADEGRCDEAKPVFEQSIHQYPQDWFAWAGLGECFVQLNDLPGAEQSLRRASELSREPRVIEQWQQVRSMMGLAPASLNK